MTLPFSGSASDIEKGLVRRKRSEAVRPFGGHLRSNVYPGLKGQRRVWRGRAPVNPSTDRTINLQNTCSHSVPETAPELREQPKNDFIDKDSELRHWALDFSVRRQR
jgi:hypothetical protein